MSSSNFDPARRLDELFPAPSHPPSQLSPQRFPGASLDSLTALQEVLKDNHQHHHIFFNNTQFHNHITHRALAIYALGGSATIIRDYYRRDGLIQRPAFGSPEPITEENFVDHLGDENFYQAYVTFFSERISKNGATKTLEEFLFSEKYNLQKERDAVAQPGMLARLYAGIFHPLIHVGYGVEFGLKGMLVEGLALTAIHKLRTAEIIPRHLFTFVPSDAIDIAVNRLSSLAVDNPLVKSDQNVFEGEDVHAFDIVASILEDDRIDRIPVADFDERFVETVAKFTPVLHEHAEKWSVDTNRPGEIERKVEELSWLCSLLYGAGGTTPSGFRAEFFLMHMVTSSIFLPSLTACLAPRSQVLLLRGYLIMVLVWWAMRGKPALNIKAFMTTTSVEPSITITPVAKTLPPSTETTPTPNPFLPILQSTITHPNDHLAKTQRAFAHFDALYGRRPAGHFKSTRLEDAELLDGSLFLRAASVTANSIGWVREGEEAKPFSMEGFFS